MKWGKPSGLWYKWFAWRPIKTDYPDNKWIWLEYVYKLKSRNEVKFREIHE